MANRNNNSSNGKTINSHASMDKAVKSVCDILRRDKAKGVRLYRNTNGSCKDIESFKLTNYIRRGKFKVRLSPTSVRTGPSRKTRIIRKTQQNKPKPAILKNKLTPLDVLVPLDVYHLMVYYLTGLTEWFTSSMTSHRMRLQLWKGRYEIRNILFFKDTS